MEKNEIDVVKTGLIVGILAAAILLSVLLLFQTVPTAPPTARSSGIEGLKVLPNDNPGPGPGPVAEPSTKGTSLEEKTIEQYFKKINSLDF